MNEHFVKILNELRDVQVHASFDISCNENIVINNIINDALIDIEDYIIGCIGKHNV